MQIELRSLAVSLCDARLPDGLENDEYARRFGDLERKLQDARVLYLQIEQASLMPSETAFAIDVSVSKDWLAEMIDEIAGDLASLWDHRRQSLLDAINPLMVPPGQYFEAMQAASLAAAERLAVDGAQQRTALIEDDPAFVAARAEYFEANLRVRTLTERLRQNDRLKSVGDKKGRELRSRRQVAAG